MPCVTSVCTLCSTKSALRLSLKQAAKRLVIADDDAIGGTEEQRASVGGGAPTVE
jgi:hypothetical protein